MKFRLGGEDRERLGAPEVLEVDFGRLMLKEAIAIQRFGVDPDRILAEAKTGNLLAMAVVVWLGLRRAGVEVALDELDIELGGLDVLDEPEPESPKAPTSPTVPTGSRRTASRSGAGRRAKSSASTS